MRRMVLFVIFSVLSSGFVAGAADDGHERTDELVKRIEKTLKEIQEGRKRLERTLEAYHKMLSTNGDSRRSAFEKVTKGLEKQEERSKELRKRFEEMQKEARKYFNEWRKSLGQIEDGKLRARSESRLDDTQRRFEELVAAGRAVREGFEPVVRGLEDQMVYLGHDLNETSTESLSADAQVITDLSRQLVDGIEGYSIVASAYIDALKK